VGLKEFLNINELVDLSEQQKSADASCGGVVRKGVIRKRRSLEKLLDLQTSLENTFELFSISDASLSNIPPHHRTLMRGENGNFERALIRKSLPKEQ
jgi:hypothetical protein